MDQQTQMAPDIQAFFDKTLPNDKGTHVLCIGENHTKSEHIHFLQNQLSNLRINHNLSVIGEERPVIYNVLLWAYKDGTLQKELGSKERAQSYFRDIWLAGVAYDADHINQEASVATVEQAKQTANLLIQAMDLGICPVAFDSRTLHQELAHENDKKVYQSF